MRHKEVGKAQILMVDDEAEIREVIKILLESEGYEVLEAETGELALAKFSLSTDLIILDINMPGVSGYQVCQKIRSISNVPILFLTAKTQESDLLMGYTVGGDDYLSKPFSYSELLARVKGLLRRYTVYQGKNIQTRRSEYLEWQNIRLNYDRNNVYKDQQELNLTNTEYRTLRLLLSCPRQTFSAQNIYESVWNEPYFPGANNTIMVFIRKLREKIEENPKNPKILVTVWGKGYRIE